MGLPPVYLIVSLMVVGLMHAFRDQIYGATTYPVRPDYLIGKKSSFKATGFNTE